MSPDAPLAPQTPLQSKLARATQWAPADLDALLKERKDALAFLAENAAGRVLIGSKKAYPLLQALLFRLVDKPKLDATPLFPLLRALIDFGLSRRFDGSAGVT